MSLGLFFLLLALVSFNVLLFCGGGRFVIPAEDEGLTEQLEHTVNT